MAKTRARSTRSTSATSGRRSPAAKKVIAKRAAPAPKAPKRKATPATKKAVKKEPVRPKKTALTREDRKSAKTLDLCLILDCTGSMYSWIQRSKETLSQIIDHVKLSNKGLTVRVGFVAYRDV